MGLPVFMTVSVLHALLIMPVVGNKVPAAGCIPSRTQTTFAHSRCTTLAAAQAAP